MIIMTGFAGLAGTMTLLENEKESLLKRFSHSFLDSVPAYDPSEAAKITGSILEDRGVQNMIKAGKDGIYAALWELGEQMSCGMRIDAPSLSILQETIEIADCLDINPYEDDSTGCFLFTAEGEKADLIIRKLQEKGIAAGIIGYETKDRDRLLVKGTERRYLTPASRIESEKKQRETYNAKRDK
ncbi:MAG: hypothetical protein IJS86_02685 [Lachnospiraceae bacterium]|nr:hypothetical protein [Lachnospiraceae bacterium]